ncbi:MAG: hypothetical protein JXR65_04620 [Bacteroidales bacterium]|nr:hypothetical protein [Bacteroidales bacterium]
MGSPAVQNKKEMGTTPVFFTAISTILGAILFLRFGVAVGTVGMAGVILLIIIGHMVTLPTAMAISEIATNQKVEGGGEYYMISRSFGLNIGATIGISLYLSQAISVAFYIIAFTAAFGPVIDYVQTLYHIQIPTQAISIPALLILGVLIWKKGASLGVKLLYIVVAMLFLSLASFFLGHPVQTDPNQMSALSSPPFKNLDQLFIVFAIIFPAFTGMDAGVGLSGDLKKPQKSIPRGTILATITGMIIYIFVVIKLNASASEQDLLSNPLIMSKIALYGWIIIPLGLAAATLSSAIGSILVAPRTLQAIAIDSSFPSKNVNRFLGKGVGKTNEPQNATLVTLILALVFVSFGGIDVVAKIISMFFMMTYASMNLISFFNHFGADPSYRPTFKSKWYFSLAGFFAATLLMFLMSPLYAFISIVSIFVLYLIIRHYHKKREGLESIFQGVIFQISRKLAVYLQSSAKKTETWRPSAICISSDTFERDKIFDLLNWISFSHGFGTYIHYIEGYYSKETHNESQKVLQRLIKKANKTAGNMIVDTVISPSYTSAIAQIIQTPGVSGMENNMIIFEYDKQQPAQLPRIIDNLRMVEAGDFDICILGTSMRNMNFSNGIHIWIRDINRDNERLMVLLSYVIMGHPSWKEATMSLFILSEKNKMEETRNSSTQFILEGRIPVSPKNIRVIEKEPEVNFRTTIGQYSSEAALTIVGFYNEQIKHEGEKHFEGFETVGDILFVNAHNIIEIE